MGARPVLELRDLVTAYGPVRAVDGVSISVPAGRILAVLGANGAGKTSLLRTISGLIRPQAGQVVLGGRRLDGLPPEEVVTRGVAHVPEGRGVIAELTVDENLRLGGLWRRDRPDRRRALREMYELFPRLAERRTWPANNLSGGERQMLVIGRALMARPKVLLLDEPSLGLAPLVVAQVMALVRRLRDEAALTVLLAEQNARSALSIADRAVVLSLGRVAVEGDPERLLADDGLRHAYLGF
jgi:branched-chain amino acid transport system ATP-binding protein